VITACLNGERFLAEAVDSVLGQTFQDFEYILIDDGSTDGSSRIARSYAERHPGRVRYMEHPGRRNIGLSPSRNVGIRAARGALVGFLDADDVWLPDKLADQVAVMDAHPEVGLVAGSMSRWSSWEGGRDVTSVVGHVQNEVISGSHVALAMYPLGRAATPPPSAFLVRTEVVERIGYFEESFDGPRALFEDQALLAKVFVDSPVYFSDKICLLYRQLSDSMSTTSRASGKHRVAKTHFYDWVVGYVGTVPGVDPDLVIAYQRGRRDHRRTVRKEKARGIARALLRRS
jgi:glycosyltransferase involved in cell wall biosynthesis